MRLESWGFYNYGVLLEKEQEVLTNRSSEEPTMVENGDFLGRNPTMAKKGKIEKWFFKKESTIVEEEKKMKKIKGEITTQQIVLLIILLVSFIIILFLLFRINFGKETDSEVCHNSVVMRGSSVLPADATSLKCSRTYICITKDGSCEGMTKPEIKKVKTKEELYNALAEEMANCWWMFGEGKVNYVTKTMLKNNYCSICSQIGFDNSIMDMKDESGAAVFTENEISKDELYDYLSVTPLPDKEMNYAEYMLGTNDVNSFKGELSNQAGKEVSFGKIKIGEQYFVVMGITSQVKAITWVLGGVVVGGVAVIGLATAGIGTAGMIAIVAGDIAGGVVGGGAAKISDIISPKIGAIVIDGDGVKNKFMTPTIQEANSDEFKLLNCEEIITYT